MDWDMVIGSGGDNDSPVDLVVRNQPEIGRPEVSETGYVTSGNIARRRIVHRATNWDGLDSSCGDCCSLQ